MRSGEGRRSPGKMATVGSAERSGRVSKAAAESSASRSGSGAAIDTRAETRSSPPQEDEPKKRCSLCVEAEPGSPPCGHPACPLCLVREERVWRRTDTEKSNNRPGRRDYDKRRGECVYRGGAAGEKTQTFCCMSSVWIYC